MKVSIITATFNSADTIKDTLRSVEQQSYNDIEHLIIDGASTDNTIAEIKAIGSSVIISSEKDNGIYDAMNKGISKASGDIIGILNSDDFYTNSDVIAKVVKLFEETNCDAVYADLEFVDQYDATTVVRKWVAGSYKAESFYNGWMPPHPTFFVRKNVYNKFGAFNKNFKNSSDYELLLRLMFVQEIKVSYLPDVIVHMRVGGYSNSSWKNRIAAHKEDYKAWQLNGISPKWYTVPMKPLRKIEQYRYSLLPASSIKFSKQPLNIAGLLHSALIPNQRVIVSYAIMFTSFISLIHLVS